MERLTHNGGGNTPTTTSTYDFGISSSTLEYFSGGNHRWYCGTGGGASYGTERMTLIDNVLRIGQTTVGAFTNGSVLNCYGSDGSGLSDIFKHPNDTAGIGIVWDGIVALGYNTNANIWMRPRGTGMFQVASSTYAISQSMGFLGPGGASSLNLNWTGICAKFNGSAWTTAYFLSSSDTRIKEDIQDINDDDALNKLLAIEPKTYKYIDKITKGDKKVYGFIAQQKKK